MPIRIEFFGIPRQRAGVESIDVVADELGDAFEQILQQLPQLEGICISGRQLQAGYIANINGQSFTTNPTTPLTSGDQVLILSADAGG